MMNNIEEKRNRLNLEIRNLLAIINMLDGMDFSYPNYESNKKTEEEYLDQQIILVADAKFRLMDIFKD